MNSNSGNPLRINPVAYAVSVALTGSYAPAVLAQNQHQRLVEQAALIEVGDQAGESAVEPRH